MGAFASRRKETLDGDEINFDHFQVLRAIGRGSFGKVCIVQKRDTRQMYAMKYMNKTQCEARDALSNVFREIEILASLDHPFMVNLWFSFQDSEDMFMVVDLLLGGDLRYHLQQGVSFSDQTVTLYIMEVSSALGYLHARHIIHRDIKPDNLLLDEEGHVHLTDFNIATVLRADQLATSMSGTKPYMAPEVFECAADTCTGYDYSVDWWSLGVTAYEVRRGKRPFDIHSSTCLSEIRHMFLHLPRFPSDCHPGLVHLLSRLLTVDPEKRIRNLEELRQLPYAAQLTLDDVLHKRCKPSYTPPRDHLNCDPTFELEEMIIEARPLHKKKKRLSKQKSLRETSTSLSATTEGESEAYSRMMVYNREVEEARREREKREREWQEELEESMRLSDPTGQGCTFTGTPTKKASLRGKGEGRERQNGDEGDGEDQDNSPTLLSSPLDHPPSPLSRTSVSPSNVRARIAGSPKVKVRGSTVTIESPRSSSSLTKTSTHHLKERLRELQDQRQAASRSHSSSRDSDLTHSHALTLTRPRSPHPTPRRSEEKSSPRSPKPASRSPPRPTTGSSDRSRRSSSRSSGHERSPSRLSDKPSYERSEMGSPSSRSRVKASNRTADLSRRSATRSPDRSSVISSTRSPDRSSNISSRSGDGRSRFHRSCSRSPGRSGEEGEGEEDHLTNGGEGGGGRGKKIPLCPSLGAPSPAHTSHFNQNQRRCSKNLIIEVNNT